MYTCLPQSMKNCFTLFFFFSTGRLSFSSLPTFKYVFVINARFLVRKICNYKLALSSHILRNGQALLTRVVARTTQEPSKDKLTNSSIPIMSTRNNQMDDPRNSALETPFVLPKTWHRGANGSSYLFGHLWMVINVFFFLR